MLTLVGKFGSKSTVKSAPTTLSITTISIKAFCPTIRNDAQHVCIWQNKLYTDCCYALCCLTPSVLFICVAILIVVMLDVVMLSVVAPLNLLKWK